jgi:hypothetical protein
MHMDASIVHINEHPNSKNNNNTNITIPILSFNEIRLNEYWPPTVSCSSIQSLYVCIYREKKTT